MTEANDYSEIATELAGNDKSNDAQLSLLAREMFERERDVETKAETLRIAQDRLDEIKIHRLPELMQTLHLPKFDFVDPYSGRRWVVKFVDTCFASIPKETTPEQLDAAMDWVVKIGQGGAVQKNFVAALGLADADTIQRVRSAVALAAPTVTTKIERKVHPSTLSAIVRKELEKGVTVPEGIKVTPKKEAACTERK